MPKIPPSERPLVTVRGTLHVATARRGTASEQPALVLDAGKRGRLVLVKLGGPSFGTSVDADLDGRKADVTGYLLGSELRYTRIEPVARDTPTGA